MGVAEKAAYVQKGKGVKVRSPILALQVPIAVCLVLQLIVVLLQLAGHAQPSVRRPLHLGLTDQIENGVEVGTGLYEIEDGRPDAALE
jgi:hypothetical protein